MTSEMYTPPTERNPELCSITGGGRERLTDDGVDPVVVSVEEAALADLAALAEGTAQEGADHPAAVHLHVPDPERRVSSVLQHLLKVDPGEPGRHTGRQHGCDTHEVILGSLGRRLLAVDVVQLKSSVC